MNRVLQKGGVPGARLAIIQHGDYRDALQIIGTDQPEPYFGMRYSLKVLQELTNDAPYLLISLNAPEYAEEFGVGTIRGMPAIKLPRPLPGKLGLWLWGRQIRATLEEFGPERVFLRSGVPAVAVQVLEYSTQRDMDILAIMQNVWYHPRHPWDAFLQRRLASLLNHRRVFLVGNHKHPATCSMIERGVAAHKSVAWDWPAARTPDKFSCKVLLVDQPTTITYVGAVTVEKGVGDLIEAVRLLQRKGRNVRLTVCGTGDAFDQFSQAAVDEPYLEFRGRVGNDEAFQTMLDSTLVCVPSRHVFTEGMPLTLTEALASRTPVVASDHPVFLRALRADEGIVFARERDPAALASAIEHATHDPEVYATLSARTADAFQRVACKNEFGDLVDAWLVHDYDLLPEPPAYHDSNAPKSKL